MLIITDTDDEANTLITLMEKDNPSADIAFDTACTEMMERFVATRHRLREEVEHNLDKKSCARKSFDIRHLNRREQLHEGQKISLKA